MGTRRWDQASAHFCRAPCRTTRTSKSSLTRRSTCTTALCATALGRWRCGRYETAVTQPLTCRLERTLGASALSACICPSQEKLLALEIAERPYDDVKGTFEAALAVGFASASTWGWGCGGLNGWRVRRQVADHRLLLAVSGLPGAVDELPQLSFPAHRAKGWYVWQAVLHRTSGPALTDPSVSLAAFCSGGRQEGRGQEEQRWDRRDLPSPFASQPSVLTPASPTCNGV